MLKAKRNQPETLKKHGQTKGISTILIDKLNNLDIFKRPVHCSDILNETIYVKDSDIWEKEGDNAPKLKYALDAITKKSVQSLPVVQCQVEDCEQTVNEVLRFPRNDKKIITSVAREICIKNSEFDKESFDTEL